MHVTGVYTRVKINAENKANSSPSTEMAFDTFRVQMLIKIVLINRKISLDCDIVKVSSLRKNPITGNRATQRPNAKGRKSKYVIPDPDYQQQKRK